MFKLFFAKFVRLALALLLSLSLLLPLLNQAQAQTNPTPASSGAPVWFKDLPQYADLKPLQIEDSVLTQLGLSRSQFFIQAALTPDSVSTVADFYNSKLGAAGWKGQITPLPTAEQGQQILFTNSQKAGGFLLLLVVSREALAQSPQYQALLARVPEGQTLVAMGAPAVAGSIAQQPVVTTAPAQASQNTPNPATTVQAVATAAPKTDSQDLPQAPNWFNFIPIYNGLQKIEVDDATLSAVGISPSSYYVVAGSTGDTVAKVADFYTKEMKNRGWSAPEKTPLVSEDLGLQLTFGGGARQLIVLVASKAALGLAPQFKALSSKLGEGQTLIALAAPADKAPEKATRCTPGAECSVGPYKIKVNLSSATFNTTDKFTATVERLDKPAGDWQMQVEAKPSTTTEATPVKFSGDFERGTAAKREAQIDFPISGNWFVYITIKDAAGAATLLVPARVEPPAVMDEKLAWLIGLSPLLGILAFAFGQWRLIVKRNRARQEATPDPEPVDTLV